MTCEFCDNDGTNLGHITICDDCIAEAEFQTERAVEQALDEAVAERTLQTTAIWEAEGGDSEFPW
jgi:hypothetical protein